MKLEKLFSCVKEKWPSEMDISNAELHSDGGFCCWEQIKIEEEISKAVQEKEGLIAAAIWPFHQALSKVSS